ncbi:transcriptional regulator, GntR family [Desulfofarcimen acetoxidans DSM 771]|uniref:Transcriptional regulator, GntR family n=1 Tax=Desulfofarcimen acetoxidans (strain ATCC 49208 / DSM 771 / KCTC 5769 / VKM B-1644 / 5575) TaxID=485916 RepID=C8VVK1_DESAS|nr:GntR family transcriptional regulator [Desulfofarcimen acetoxidans]ACV62316.1 transcriptional regulator, GntR family [Desulfofarcimen acetoxidans DSM 771]
MSRKRKWEEIADTMREQIISGKFKPGQDFPTNLELMKTFEVHAATIQQAVNALITEGLVISSGSSSNRRTVYKPPERSVRSAGFLTEVGSRGTQEILELKIIDTADEAPEDVSKHFSFPILKYKTRQYRDNIPVAISEAYLSNNIPLEKFKEELMDPAVELYSLMKKYGFNPTTCRESLVVSSPNLEEQELLRLPRLTFLPTVRITRLVYDSKGCLLEYCLLVDRADCYEFTYEFPLTVVK